MGKWETGLPIPLQSCSAEVVLMLVNFIINGRAYFALLIYIAEQEHLMQNMQ